MRGRPVLPFLPTVSRGRHCHSLTQPASRDILNQFRQTDGFTIRGFVAGIAATRRKHGCAPTADPNLEPWERRKGHGKRCRLRIAGNQSDACARKITDLQLVVEAVSVDPIDVERCVELRKRSQREIVQRPKSFCIRHTRIRVRWRPFRTPSTHTSIAPCPSTPSCSGRRPATRDLELGRAQSASAPSRRKRRHPVGTACHPAPPAPCSCSCPTSEALMSDMAASGPAQPTILTSLGSNTVACTKKFASSCRIRSGSAKTSASPD